MGRNLSKSPADGKSKGRAAAQTQLNCVQLRTRTPIIARCRL
jgi:hypothetical protein